MNEKRNVRLKVVSIERGISFFEIARLTGIHNTRVSQIANSWVRPSDDEKKKIAEALHVKVGDIFPEATVD